MQSPCINLLTLFLIVFPLIVIRYRVFLFRWRCRNPFFGSPTVTTRSPDQVFKIPKRFLLESYHADNTQQKPIVALREISSKKVYWCFSIDADSSETSVRFTSSMRLFYDEPRIKSSINYSGSSNPAIWKISEEGYLHGIPFRHRCHLTTHCTGQRTASSLAHPLHSA